ncbi:LysM peptidoglycan-binding domain-containing protein [Luteolibacter sp. AS25]|uniref:LysM peptidoglycan-binding domain-containing protein n=1 Tax=Luteolibacter sp. AS25 TaxID=3135776 RepID=UPI00398AD98E
MRAGNKPEPGKFVTYQRQNRPLPTLGNKIAEIFLFLEQSFAYLKQLSILSLMLRAIRILLPLLILPFFTQCGSKSAPEPNAVTGPFDSSGNYIEDWVDKPEKWHRPSSDNKSKKRTPVAKKTETTPPVVVADPPPVSKPKPTVTTPAPKPKPVVVQPKPKPKPKPKPVTHTVRRGDTLTKLSRTYGVPISTIRSANNLKGDLIRIGQVLKIK